MAGGSGAITQAKIIELHLFSSTPPDTQWLQKDRLAAARHN